MYTPYTLHPIPAVPPGQGPLYTATWTVEVLVPVSTRRGQSLVPKILKHWFETLNHKTLSLKPLNPFGVGSCLYSYWRCSISRAGRV